MKFLDRLKENRIAQTIVLGVIAFILLILAYFVFFSNKQEGSQSSSVGGFTQMSQTESRLCSILSEIEGVGKINAYVNEDSAGDVTGVILVFEGADRISVRMDVMRATARALNISQNNVLIYKMTT